MHVLDYLNSRGLVKQFSHYDALYEHLKHPRTLYLGLDPTYHSYHIGHLIVLLTLRYFYLHGHTVIIVMGGGTALIGDPSGRSSSRQMLSSEKINQHIHDLSQQLYRIIDIHDERCMVRNNADWLSSLNYLDVLRNIASHFSVNRMLSFDTYKTRLDSGLSFLEFNYQIIQAYDFLHLFQNYQCTVQIGGDDQWGNMLSGVDLIRRKCQTEVYTMTVPLLTNWEGKKMGKTENQTVFLDKELSSTTDFYQYFRNTDDRDVQKFLLLLSDFDKDEIQAWVNVPQADINKAKEILAHYMTNLVHGSLEAERVQEHLRASFSKNISEMQATVLQKKHLLEGTVLDLFMYYQLSPSRSEFRRLVNQGGVRINAKVISDPFVLVSTFIHKDNYLILQIGKKKYFKIEWDKLIWPGE